MNTTKIKENAKQEFIDFVKKSWTYEKLTEEEQERLIDCIERARPVGSFDQRWTYYNDIFWAFLQGCGYNPTNWRE